MICIELYGEQTVTDPQRALPAGIFAHLVEQKKQSGSPCVSFNGRNAVLLEFTSAQMAGGGSLWTEEGYEIPCDSGYLAVIPADWVDDPNFDRVAYDELDASNSATIDGVGLQLNGKTKVGTDDTDFEVGTAEFSFRPPELAVGAC